MNLDTYLRQHYTPVTAKAYAREISIDLSNYPAASTALETRNMVLISLRVYQALHPSEMAALRVTDIDLEAGTLRIPGTGKTKAGNYHCGQTRCYCFINISTRTDRNYWATGNRPRY